jgi:hypothetical protein
LEQEATVLAVGGIRPMASPSRTSRREAAEPSEPARTESRALIPVEAPTPSERTPTATRRPLAAFLAHLIATQSQAPQTRVRRRAEPEEALEVYSTTLAAQGPVAGRVFTGQA